MKRVVTPEIADYIRKKYRENYSRDEINELLRKKYGISLHKTTFSIYNRPFDEAFEIIRKRSPHFRRKQKEKEQMLEYKRIHSLLTSNLDKFLFYLFNEREEFSVDEISSKLEEFSSIKITENSIKRIIQSYEDRYEESPAVDLEDGFFILNKNYNPRRIRPPPYLWATKRRRERKFHYPPVKLFNRRKNHN